MPILNSKLPIGVSAAKYYHHIFLSLSLPRLTQHHHHFLNLVNRNTLLVCRSSRRNVAKQIHTHRTPLRSAGFNHFTDITPSLSNSETTSGDNFVLEKSKVDELMRTRLWKLKTELENAGIFNVAVPGLHRHMLCPKVVSIS